MWYAVAFLAGGVAVVIVAWIALMTTKTYH